MEEITPFAEEHRIFRAALHKFIEREISPHVERWEEEENFPDELFHKMGKEGFLGTTIPTKYEGAGGDYLSGAVLAEEMSRCGAAGVSAGITMHALIVLPALAKLANEEQGKRFIVPGVRGEKIGALALTEPEAGSDLAAIRSQARRENEEYILNGSKVFITNGCRADFLLVLCKTNEEQGYSGFTTLIVEKGMKGFEKPRKLKKVVWRSSDTAEMFFDQVRVPVANRLGQEGDGFANAMINLEWERLLMALGSVVGAQRNLDATIDYVRERKAFGRPLVKFQLTRHKIADLATRIEAARSLTYHCLMMLQQGLSCTREASMAKYYATEMAKRVADECVQMYGGYGLMMEYPIQRFWRDARIGTIGGGTSEIMREIIAKTMDL